MYAISSTSYRAITDAASAGADETAVSELPAALLFSILRAEARNARDAALRACDWTQMADSPLSEFQRSQWVTYRQALRDLPEQEDFPDVVWPAPPALPQGAAQVGE